MLLWQRRNSDFFPRTIFIQRYFLGSVVCHFIVIFALFFLNKDKQHDFFLDLSKNVPSMAQVRLLPLSMAKPTGSQVIGSKKSAKKGKLPAVPLVKRKNKTSVKPLTTVMQQKKNAPVKKIKDAKSKKKIVSKATDLKKKNKAAEIKDNKQDQIELINKEDKQVEKIVEKPQEVVEKEKPHEIIQEKVVIEESGGSALSSTAEGQEYLYLTKHELEAFTVGQKLRDCLFDVWTVPLGVPSSAACEVAITIGWDGVILATDFVKKSGILMYDLSVQETLEQVHFPHEMWGKQITVVFKP